MPSIRSKLFLALLRNRHLLQFKSKKDTYVDWLNNLDQVRESSMKSAKLLGKVPKGMTIKPETINNMKAEWIVPDGKKLDKIILYFHGGGYVLGTIEAHRSIVSKFVKESGVPALVFDYRLAPENPFPTGLNDAIEAYQFLLDNNVLPENIVFCGDSGGGGLCLATLIAAKDKGMPMPRAAVTLSAWTDLAFTGESYTTNVKTCLSPPNSWEACRAHYIGEKDPTHPWISPLYADLKGLPNLKMFAGNDETLRDDTIRFAEKAKESGVNVELEVGEGMCHCYPACSPMFPEATEAMKDIGRFIRKELAV